MINQNRPKTRDDGFPARADMQQWTPAEKAIADAVQAVEASGGSPALTDAVNLLAKARERVADHVEGDGYLPIEKHEVVWLIERVDERGNTTGYLWAEPERFWWADIVQDFSNGALRFARERDARAFVYAMRKLQQNLPYKDVIPGLVSSDDRFRIADHIWITREVIK